MRIIGGTLRGRTIAAPKGDIARPTTDRVREALFNVIDHGRRPSSGARVLDLFAGSGALGIEALSRGAVFALFVEEHPSARGAVRDNLDTLGLSGRGRIFKRDARKLGALPGNIPEPFDLVFCDPPYGKGLGPVALTGALREGWLTGEALAVFEMAKSETTPEVEGFALTGERVYGDTKIAFYDVAGG